MARQPAELSEEDKDFNEVCEELGLEDGDQRITVKQLLARDRIRDRARKRAEEQEAARKAEAEKAKPKGGLSWRK